MKALFNNKIIEDHLIVKLNNRALQFGDGLFETIITHKYEVPLLKLHYDRLMHGAELLSLNISLTLTEFTDKIVEVIEANGVHDFNRVKVILWRGDDQQQGYNSASTSTDLLITAKPTAQPVIRIIENAGFSEKVKLTHHSFSSLKTISALSYTMAALERSNKGLDELILTDGFNHISECVSSNLFWINQNQIFTPSLTSGCVAGVMRQHLINLLKSNGYIINEILTEQEVMMASELIFTTNVAGIGIIKAIEGHSYTTSNPLFDKIKQLLAL